LRITCTLSKRRSSDLLRSMYGIRWRHFGCQRMRERFGKRGGVEVKGASCDQNQLVKSFAFSQKCILSFILFSPAQGFLPIRILVISNLLPTGSHQGNLREPLPMRAPSEMQRPYPYPKFIVEIRVYLAPCSPNNNAVRKCIELLSRSSNL
jgi:hypothetical protein